MKRIATIALSVAGLIGTAVSVFSMSPGATRPIVISAFLLCLIIGLVGHLALLINLRSAFSILLTSKKLGIFKLHPDDKSLSVLSQKLSSAKTIDIMAVTAQRLIRGHKKQFVAALSNNAARIRVLLAEPNSELLQDVEEAEGPLRKGQLKPESQQVERLLSEYLADAIEHAGPKKPAGSISLGYYTTHLRSSLILCDEDWGSLTLSLPPKRATDSMSIEMITTETKESVLHDSINHFDRTWEIAEKRGRVRTVEPEKRI
jgi:hypothetical protein